MQDHLFAGGDKRIQKQEVHGLKPGVKKLLGIAPVLSALKGDIEAVDAGFGNVLRESGKRPADLGQALGHGLGVLTKMRRHDLIPGGNGAYGAACRDKGREDGLEDIGLLPHLVHKPSSKLDLLGEDRVLRGEIRHMPPILRLCDREFGIDVIEHNL